MLERGIGLPAAPLTVIDVIAQRVAQHQAMAKLRTEEVREGELLSARVVHRRDWARYEQVRAEWERHRVTPGMFAAPATTEEKVREHVNAFIATLAGELGITTTLAAEARAGRLTAFGGTLTTQR
ncbi:hypothetical protein ACFVGY_32990 [Streptomyces sp. NPDC127106]|uniref:hypothetical protein n=1 Tax=Streptomyces sp. NPDC127106 TaxID=3345360 RepID=UPI003627532B